MTPCTTHIEWEAPATRTNWFLGTGATSAERVSVWLTVAIGTGALIATAHTAGWHGWPAWRIVIVAVLAVDILGGVTANGLGTAKRLYHGPLPADAGPMGRLVHRSWAFTALHVHPLAVGWLFDAPWWWGPLWYLWALAGVVAVHRVPLYLARPVALSVTTIGITLTTLTPSPEGLAWFVPALLLKLVLAHAVHEEPYRPAPAN